MFRIDISISSGSICLTGIVSPLLKDFTLFALFFFLSVFFFFAFETGVLVVILLVDVLISSIEILFDILFTLFSLFDFILGTLSIFFFFFPFLLFPDFHLFLQEAIFFLLLQVLQVSPDMHHLHRFRDFVPSNMLLHFEDKR